MHAAKETLMLMIANIRTALRHVRTVAEQLPTTDRWKTLLDYVVAKITQPRNPRLLEQTLFLPGNCRI
jgi:hypothetical protein